MKLGQLLVKKRIIDSPQLRAALARQEREGGRLGRVLVDMGVVSRKAVLDALRTKPEFVADAVRLSEADPEALRLVPRTVARELSCLALEIRDNRLLVAMVDPLDDRVIDRLEQLTGMRVEPLLASADELRQAVRRHFTVRVGSIYEPATAQEPDEVVTVVKPESEPGPSDADRRRRLVNAEDSDAGRRRGSRDAGRRQRKSWIRAV